MPVARACCDHKTAAPEASCDRQTTPRERLSLTDLVKNVTDFQNVYTQKIFRLTLNHYWPTTTLIQLIYCLVIQEKETMSIQSLNYLFMAGQKVGFYVTAP